MAFNPSPKVAAARDYGKKFNGEIVIILTLRKSDGKLEYASYGETKRLCDEAKKFADIAMTAIQNSDEW